MDEQEIKKVGAKFAEDFLKIACSTEKDQDNNVIEWKFVKKSGIISIYSRPSTFINGTVYKTVIDLDYSPLHVLTLLSTIHKYRFMWDPLVENIEIIEPKPAKDKHMYLVHHFVKAQYKLISSRDSIDVVSYGKTNDFYFISASSVTLPDYPPTKGMVRATAYPSGYAVWKVPGQPNKCKWEMIFHADINMNSIGTFIVDMVKPTLVTIKATGLLSHIDSLKVDPNDMFKDEMIPAYDVVKEENNNNMK